MKVTSSKRNGKRYRPIVEEVTGLSICTYSSDGTGCNADFDFGDRWFSLCLTRGEALRFHNDIENFLSETQPPTKGKNK